MKSSIEIKLNSDRALVENRVCGFQPQRDNNERLQLQGQATGRWSPLHLSWIYLALAVATEVIGLTLMKISVSMGRVEGLILLYVLVSLSYFFLAKAVKSISVGVAYAIWEGSGIALITLVSAVVLQQMLTVRELCGLAMVVVGNFMIHAGEVPADSSVDPTSLKR